MQFNNQRSYLGIFVASALVLTATPAFALTICGFGSAQNVPSTNWTESRCDCNVGNTATQITGYIDGFRTSSQTVTFNQFLDVKSLVPAQVWVQTLETPVGGGSPTFVFPPLGG